MSKTVFLVADGMAGWPLDILGGRTSLHAASTPTLDLLAPKSRCGLCRTVPHGMPPGSDVANMSLLGYDPQTHHTGRGPIEAAAQGLTLDQDDLVWRMNLVRLTELTDAGVMLDYSAGHISTPEAAPLVARLADMAGGTPFQAVQGIQYRHLLVQRGGALTDAAELAIRPPHDILDQNIAQDLTAYASFPEMLAFLQTAHEYLRAETTSEATSVWPWGQGRPLELPAFAERFGLRGAVVSAVDLVKGLGRAAGMEVLEVPGANGLIDTNYEGKVEAALDFLQRGEFVYVHVEAPDECGHMGDAALKKRAIELFDQRIVAPILAALAHEDATIVVTCDHFTPVARRTHTEDPVPFLIYRTQAPRTDGPNVFNEDTAKGAGLFINDGRELLTFCLGPDA
ncbi:cofactor-independent phosphoglycerate mutase [Desulfomicrobium baculatum]|uniref:Phosphonopyruvate decarboxylase-related protein n=1 Tax=Desulfomicrobium baculatum (strain DSM 4028 / VKM B-1378 / X) TaxID=525897 RepID=C7LPX7_DESBD|nr:cofactor-independent phosphoglycerate mutase [Desulfomicrobium baculatum]ACU91459.1 phosphonopyruvate decarboxylase-related protein [Desulfomicrobium baculatum DSM 4028]